METVRTSLLQNNITLNVTTWYTGCSGKEQAVKVLEEAAEMFAAWESAHETRKAVIFTHLEDEIADVITAACNLANMYDLDISEAMKRCVERNHERGRY